MANLSTGKVFKMGGYCKILILGGVKNKEGNFESVASEINQVLKRNPGTENTRIPVTPDTNNGKS